VNGTTTNAGTTSVTQSVEYFDGASSLGTTDPATETGTTTSLTKYVNTVTGDIEPQTQGQFTFKRKVRN
jgi:hypothetical protein